MIVELLRWGDRYAAPAAGPPIVLRHRDCGGLMDEWRICENCGKPLGPRDVRAEPGPGAMPLETRGDASEARSQVPDAAPAAEHSAA